MNLATQLQTRPTTQGRDTAMLPVEMPSKRRPTWDPEIIRARMVGARMKRGLDVKGAAAAAGMGSKWSWYKKEPPGGVEFQPAECIEFAKNVKAPTLFPFYDWDEAEELDEDLGWDK